MTSFIYYADTGSDYIALNARVINESLIGKDMEESGCGLIQHTISAFLVITRENHENSK